jgi:predicted RNase H-like HicB family nuclease/predicted RNA binding protein YcfA (HicA-like mRNA interferase family)
MTLCDDISKSVLRGEKMPDIDLNLVFREVREEGDVYFVAECLEIPGCVSQGATQAEAEANIKDAVGACLKVMVMEAVKRLVDRSIDRDLRGISSQRKLTISQPVPEMAFA